MSALTSPSKTAEYREALKDAMPVLLAEWIELVKSAEDPKAYKDLLDHAAKVLGMDKEGQAANLPMFAISFVLPDGTQMAGMPLPTVEVVEVDAQPVAQPAELTDGQEPLALEASPASPVVDEDLGALVELDI
jgi:hypothetical protein